MALTPDDYRDILRHLRIRLQDVGGTDIDYVLSASLEPTGDPRSDLLRYLEMLIQAYKERSRGTYELALGSLREHVQAGEGEAIAGVYVDLSPSASEAYDIDAIRLDDLPDYSMLVNDLEALLNDLREEPY